MKEIFRHNIKQCIAYSGPCWWYKGCVARWDVEKKIEKHIFKSGLILSHWISGYKKSMLSSSEPNRRDG